MADKRYVWNEWLTAQLNVEALSWRRRKFTTASLWLRLLAALSGSVTLASAVTAAATSAPWVSGAWKVFGTACAVLAVINGVLDLGAQAKTLEGVERIWEEMEQKYRALYRDVDTLDAKKLRARLDAADAEEAKVGHVTQPWSVTDWERDRAEKIVRKRHGKR